MFRRFLLLGPVIGLVVVSMLVIYTEAHASDCVVEAFSVSPNSSSQAVGTILSLYGRGNCAGGIRASRFNIDGGGFGEDAGAPEQSETWQLTAGTHTICFEIAGGSNGDWAAGARSCTTITGTSNPPPPSNPINPVLNGPYITTTGNCQWEIRYTLSGFAPNSTITVSSNYSETVCSTGQQVSSSWTVAQGSTDGNGNFTFVATHHGTGSYNYTFRDGQGNSRASSFSTSNSNPNPPVNPPPSNPTTGGNNPTTGNTNPTNPTTGNPNPVVPPPSSPSVPQVGSTTPPQGSWVRVVAPAGMNVRNGPGINYSIVATIANGRYLQYDRSQSGWHHVTWNGGDGWVSGGSQYTVVGPTVDLSQYELQTSPVAASSAQINPNMTRWCKGTVVQSFWAPQGDDGKPDFMVEYRIPRNRELRARWLIQEPEVRLSTNGITYDTYIIVIGGSVLYEHGLGNVSSVVLRQLAWVEYKC